MTSIQSLSERAARMSSHHSTVGSATEPPPAIAAADPFIELLIHELAGRLPASMRNKLFSATSTEQIDGLLAAAAILGYISNDRPLTTRFLAQLDQTKDPGSVALAFGKAYAQNNEPPLRTAEWRRKDRAGLFIATLLFLLAVVLRFVVLASVDRVVSPTPVPIIDHLSPSGLLGLSLMIQPLRPGIVTALSVMGLCFWFVFESAFLPSLLEFARRWPAVRAKLPPPIPWRMDALNTLVALQGCVMLSAVFLRWLIFLGYSWWNDELNGGSWFLIFLTGYFAAAIAMSVAEHRARKPHFGTID